VGVRAKEEQDKEEEDLCDSRCLTTRQLSPNASFARDLGKVKVKRPTKGMKMATATLSMKCGSAPCQRLQLRPHALRHCEAAGI
jgi:hypothetical protein